VDRFCRNILKMVGEVGLSQTILNYLLNRNILIDCTNRNEKALQLYLIINSAKLETERINLE